MKRLDLQGIRGTAILSVLGFHFYPEWVPNGYLGVDQFFVLSGFLMAMLLEKSIQLNPFCLVCQFYSRRLKRILPLYFFVIFSSLMSLYLYFPEVSWKTNQKSGNQALILMSNRGTTAEEDYFRMLSIAIDLFTHTWSLSVEVQFYLLIPWIYLVGRGFPRKLQFLLYTIIGTISYIYSSTSTASTAFNSVFARIWQFFIGFVTYLLSQPPENNCQYETIPEDDGKRDSETEKFLKNNDENDEEINGKRGSWSSYFLLILTISVAFFQASPDSRVVRPFITIATGILIFTSQNDNILLANRFSVYFGDISYALYLVHWPIYAYWKVTKDEDQIALFFSLLASIFVAIIIHETYEKWYLRQNMSLIALLSAILFFSSLGLINKDEIMNQLSGNGMGYDSLGNSTWEISLNEAARLNHQWNLNDYESLFVPTCTYEGVDTPFGWCRHSEKGLTGELKIMIIGNSWVANHATMFYEECGHIAKTILQGAASACEPLYPTRLSDVCKSNFTDFEDHIRAEKPDYVFMFTRFVTIGDPSPPDHDPIYQVMKEQMLKFIPHINYKLYILQAMPRPNIEIIEKIVPMMKNGRSMEEIDTLLVNHTLYQTARRRYTQLVEHCNGKCVLVDYDPEFWNSTSENFRFFDENGLSYFTTTTHLTPRGIEKIRHLWKNICKKIGLKYFLFK